MQAACLVETRDQRQMRSSVRRTTGVYLQPFSYP